MIIKVERGLGFARINLSRFLSRGKRLGNRGKSRLCEITQSHRESSLGGVCSGNPGNQNHLCLVPCPQLSRRSRLRVGRTKRRESCAPDTHVAHACNPSMQDAEEEEYLKCQARQGYLKRQKPQKQNKTELAGRLRG